MNAFDDVWNLDFEEVHKSGHNISNAAPTTHIAAICSIHDDCIICRIFRFTMMFLVSDDFVAFR